MGWWAMDIMGGDTPLDIEDDINNRRMSCESAIQYIKDNSTDTITAGVVAHVMMQQGLPIDKELQHVIIEHVKKELDLVEEEWGSDAYQRRVHLEDLLNRVALVVGATKE